jgi:plasmid maintenance system antidote protein VapI
MATHIEEFASTLRELKERSGRSYGSLAARLHVSTSTLHRYCNGAAVPGEYAPVERFARQCGATPQELVALHRRWLLADAARRREPTRAAGTPTAPAAPTAPVTPVAPVTDAADVPQAHGPATDVRQAQPPTADVPQEESPAVELSALPPAGSDRPARLSRRTRAVLGAVAVVAVILPLALFAGRRDGGGPHATASLPRLTAGAGVGAAAPAHPSASAPATGPASAPAVPTTSARTPDSTRTPESTRTPVQATVLSDNWDTQCDQWFLLAQPPGKVPPPPPLQETNAWASALGGIPAGHLRLQVTAQVLPGQPVVLHTLYVHVASSKPAAKGLAYTPGSGCGGGLEPASFGVDLDASVPRAKPVHAAGGGDGTTPIAHFPFQVSAGDSEVLDVDAHTADQDVTWYLELAWSSGDRQGVLRIDDHGRPFRTVGLDGDPAYFYDGTAWSPAPRS